MVTNNPVSGSLWLDKMSEHKGAKKSKGDFIVFISNGLVNLRLEQQYWKVWWLELIVGLCLQSLAVRRAITEQCSEGWNSSFKCDLLPGLITFSNTKRKLKSIASWVCFAFCLVLFSFAQANPQLVILLPQPPSFWDFRCERPWKVGMLFSGSQVRNLEKVTVGEYLSMLKSVFCDSI